MSVTITRSPQSPDTSSDLSSCQTTCPYCGVGCGVDIQQQSDQLLPVKGNQAHPANFGRLCVKGSALHETLGQQGRVTHASISGKPASLDQALNTVASTFSRIIAQHGPDAVAFYVSGQLLTEDYYVANKLMKGFIGSANIDTNSRLCMSSAVAGYKRAFGSDAVPCCYEDIEQADLVILTGSNAAWTHPVLWQRLLQARTQRPELKIIVIDPRKTATGELADLYLPIRPGSDSFLYNGLLAWLSASHQTDQDFIRQHTQQFEATRQQALAGLGLDDNANSHQIMQATAKACGLPVNDLQALFTQFADTQHTLTLYSQGVNQSSSGTDKCNAIINCHLATGRIGKPGMGPFSLTGQPNAMGGREVGGLANQLAAHMDFTDEATDRLGRFWQSPEVAKAPGLKAVDLYQAAESGQIKAIWIMATNPVVSMPDADQVIRALKQCELVVVSECFTDSETSRYADIILPAAGWGEKDGTVTNSERRISRQKAFLPLSHDIKPDWWLISQVAQRMGFADAFNYQCPVDIFREHAALSGFENGTESHPVRDFDISLLASLTNLQYDQLAPVQWPVNQHAPLGTPRLFTDQQFYTPTGKANFVPVQPRLPQHQPDQQFPYILNTGRIRDQWHTMNRTARSPRLLEHISEPYVEMHPDDAEKQALRAGQLISLGSRQGSFTGRLQLNSGLQPGQLFAPMHWNRCYSGNANIDSLVNPVTDPVSGQPESKHCPVALSDPALHQHGLIITSSELILTDTEHSVTDFMASRLSTIAYWSRITLAFGERYELADKDSLYSGLTNKPTLCSQPLSPNALSDTEDTDSVPARRKDSISDSLFAVLRQLPGDWYDYQDSALGVWRSVCLQQGKLALVLASAADMEHLPARSWLSDQIGQTASAQDALALLAGARGDQADCGRTICACFQVGENSIRQVIQQGQADSVQTLGQQLSCGTNCGSCIPELKSILDDMADTQTSITA